VACSTWIGAAKPGQRLLNAMVLNVEHYRDGGGAEAISSLLQE